MLAIELVPSGAEIDVEHLNGEHQPFGQALLCVTSDLSALDGTVEVYRGYDG